MWSQRTLLAPQARHFPSFCESQEFTIYILSHGQRSNQLRKQRKQAAPKTSVRSGPNQSIDSHEKGWLSIDSLFGTLHFPNWELEIANLKELSLSIDWKQNKSQPKREMGFLCESAILSESTKARFIYLRILCVSEWGVTEWAFGSAASQEDLGLSLFTKKEAKSLNERFFLKIPSIETQTKNKIAINKVPNLIKLTLAFRARALTPLFFLFHFNESLFSYSKKISFRFDWLKVCIWPCKYIHIFFQ